MFLRPQPHFHRHSHWSVLRRCQRGFWVIFRVLNTDTSMWERDLEPPTRRWLSPLCRRVYAAKSAKDIEKVNTFAWWNHNLVPEDHRQALLWPVWSENLYLASTPTTRLSPADASETFTPQKKSRSFRRAERIHGTNSYRTVLFKQFLMDLLFHIWTEPLRDENETDVSFGSVLL